MSLEKLVEEFIRYWTTDRTPDGCGMCGGIPHSTTCYVGRMARLLDRPARGAADAAVGSASESTGTSDKCRCGERSGWLRVAYLEGTVLPHARKQANADGFQSGWHAALDRLREGRDTWEELRALVPRAGTVQPQEHAKATSVGAASQIDVSATEEAAFKAGWGAYDIGDGSNENRHAAFVAYRQSKAGSVTNG